MATQGKIQDRPSGAPEELKGTPSAGDVAPRKPEPLDPKRHGDLRIRKGQNFEFASRSHTIPLGAVEFMAVARHYPIIFAGDDEIQPVAMMGLRPGENLFVNARGMWKEGCYIPAILRRAPFVLMQESKEGRSGVSLCLDVESPLVSTDTGTNLFVEGKPAPLIAKMATFAASFSKEQTRTRGFVNALVEHDLLVERRMEITLRNGQRILFEGFRLIDEERLRGLNDAEALTWFRKGWDALAVAHFLSLGNMGRLHHRANRRASL